jgi:probable HAF family extracellular repeat protein
MKAMGKRKIIRFRSCLMALSVMMLYAGMSAEVSAAGYSVQQINAPGAAVRMSSAGNLTGAYEVKCSKLGGQPPRRICWYAPWIYDGKSVTKIQWPIDWNYVYSLGINDSLELVGREYRGSTTAGGWLYSGGAVIYSGSLPGGGGSLLAAINNGGTAVGLAQTSARISRAVTFRKSGSSYVLAEIPAYFGPDSKALPTTGIDINDQGDIVGTYTEIDGSQHAFVFVNEISKTIPIPNLPGVINCQTMRISQVYLNPANQNDPQNGNVWVVGNCGDRGFIFLIGADQSIELKNLSGASGGVAVQSVNSRGEAVGTVGGKAVMWAPGNQTAIDLNQFAPRNMIFSRGTDINDDGTILAGYNDSSGSVATYLLYPTP